MMKKLFSFATSIFFASMLFAQGTFVVSPSSMGGATLMLQGEKMSQNRHYVAGNDQGAMIPMIWNTTTDQVTMFEYADSVWTDGWYWEVYSRTGTFHSVNNNGLAVGVISEECNNFVKHPIMATIDGEVTFLHSDPSDAGAEAWGITDDGSTIVGYHFDTTWTTYACIWTNSGTVRTDLPCPTDAQVGFPVEYCSARWISADGNVILGYAQDDNTGAWVAVCWKKQNGEYTVQSFCNNYYQTKYYDESFEIQIPGNNPYFEFEPTGLSANGEWIGLNVLESHDPEDFNNVPSNKVARYNLTTNTLEVLTLEEEYDELLMFGVSNNGTLVGRLTGPLNIEDWSQDINAVVWNPQQTDIQRLVDIYPNNEYTTECFTNAFCDITADGRYVLGYGIDGLHNVTSFIVDLPYENVSIDETETEITFFPNPASTRLAVDANETIRTITMMDLKGQVVKTNTYNSNQAMIDVQNIANGMYILNVVTEKGHMTKKVTIMR